MKQTVRLSTFETNSSSCHSLIIADVDNTDELDELQSYTASGFDLEAYLDKIPYFGYTGQFTNFEEKLGYLLTAVTNLEESRLEKEMGYKSWRAEALPDDVPDFEENIAFIDSTMQEVGVKVKFPKVKFVCHDDYNWVEAVRADGKDLAVVDHGGEIPYEFTLRLLKYKVDLLSWLFSSNSQILCSCDGDNELEELRGYKHDIYVKGN